MCLHILLHLHLATSQDLKYINFCGIYRVPDFVKEKRFGNWLKDARDWAISRNRYWGTPIPLWVSDDLEEVRGLFFCYVFFS